MSGCQGRTFERSPSDVSAVYGVGSSGPSAVARATGSQKRNRRTAEESPVVHLPRVGAQQRAPGLYRPGSAAAGGGATLAAAATLQAERSAGREVRRSAFGAVLVARSDCRPLAAAVRPW